MSEDDIRNYLNGQSKIPQSMPRKSKVAKRAMPRGQRPQESPRGYDKFAATHLFCSVCRQAMPVREKLILYLPDGDLYDYLCTQCGTSLGTRKAGE